MARFALVVLVACGVVSGIQSQESPSQKYLKPFGANRFPQFYKHTLDAFFRAEDAYRAEDYSGAHRILNDFWKTYPPQTKPWEEAYSLSDQANKYSGANFGAPPCYYALLMLTECAQWRNRAKGKYPTPTTIIWTNILVGKSSGKQPTTKAEMQGNTGMQVTLTLSPQLVEKEYHALHQSQWLFKEYVKAMTDGKLDVKTEILNLPELDMPFTVKKGNASIPVTGKLWQAVPKEVKAKTDWWLVTYPSCVPGQYPDFATEEFVSGGMGGGPNGHSPLFIADDLWFVRKPPHLGRGTYTDAERRAYLPQWYQHEFFHHLYGIYPDLKLEVKGHQWFDRKTWPPDFRGNIEPDYYFESLHKRLKTDLAVPPLHVHLHNAEPPADLFKNLKSSDVVGTYKHEKAANDWHEGTISIVLEQGIEILRWTNKAGKSWKLTANFENGELKTGPDNPYFKQGGTYQSFRLVPNQDAQSGKAVQIRGFHFGDGIYLRQP